MKDKSFKIARALSIIFGIAETIYGTVNEMAQGDNFVAWIASFLGSALMVGLFGKLAMFLFIYFPAMLLEIKNGKKELTKSGIINFVISMIFGIFVAVLLALYLNSLDVYFGPLNGAPWIAAFIIYCLSFGALTTITEKRSKK